MVFGHKTKIKKPARRSDKPLGIFLTLARGLRKMMTMMPLVPLPTSKGILPGGNNRNRKANAFLGLPSDQNARIRTSRNFTEKLEIRNEVKMAIGEAGFFFLERDNETNAWSQLTEKYVGNKIRSAYNFLLNPKKTTTNEKPKME